MFLFTRKFSMPNSSTFEMHPLKELLGRYIRKDDVVVDPFARNSKLATYSNDLNPETEADFNMDAVEFCEYLDSFSIKANVVLFDPPYSPRQISECYKHVGRDVTGKDTQNAVLYKRVKDTLDRLLIRDGIAICCGWNSMGFGLNRGYEMVELLLVPHGAAHNDTIVTVERKVRS